MINDNQFCRSRRLFLPVGECLSLPSGGPPAQPGPPVIYLRPEVTGNKSKKGHEVSIPDGRAECLVLKRRLPWRGDSCEEIGPATAPLRSFHDRCFVAGQEPSAILFSNPSL